MNPESCNYGQHFVDRPKFEGSKEKKGRRENQVMTKSHIIRPDKRKKVKYL